MGKLADLLFKLGGPVLAGAIARRFGAEFGDYAKDALAALADAFGAEPTEESVTTAIETAQRSAPPGQVEAKIKIAEADMAKVFLAKAELQRAENDQQRMTNELLQENAKKPGWRSDWLYAWQWFLMFAWGWTIVLVPVLNAALRIFAGRVANDLITGVQTIDAPTLWAPDLGVLLTLTGLYLGLHMGGHTVLELVRNQWGGLFGAKNTKDAV